MFRPMLLAAGVLIGLSPGFASAADLNVLYAGSLVNLMEQGIGPAFTKATGDAFRGFAGGSNGLANQVKGQLRRGDVFISANPAVDDALMGSANGDWVSWYIRFAQSPLVIGYSPSSKFAGALKSKPWYEVLREPGIRIGRTDPKLDPKGALTVQLLAKAEQVYSQPGLAQAVLGAPDNPAQVQPEESLVGRLQSGQIDVGFFYSTETADLKIQAIPLPPEVALSARYTATVLRDAADPAGAAKFIDFLLSAPGQAIMHEHGLDTVKPVLTGDAAKLPGADPPAVRAPPRALAVLGGLLAAYLMAPFAAGLGQVGLADWRGANLAGLAQAVAVSVGSASLATILVALGGVPLAYGLARGPGRGMALLGFIVQLPLALPPLASGILLLFLFGYASPLGRLTGGALTDSFTGIVLAEAFVAAPFLIIAARSAFTAVDPVLEEVTATLGHRPWAVFRRVSLALAWRGIAAGLLLTWLRAFGEFGATVMVAYHPYSLPVFTYVAFGSQGLPAMIPVLLPTVLVAVAVMAASVFAARKPVRRRAPHASPAPAALPEAIPASVLPKQTLALAFRRQRDGFLLDVAWRTDCRRLSILGASGSGKSATLRLVAGLDRAESATLRLGGRDMAALAPHDRGIGYMPQSYGLLPHLPVDQQIRFVAGGDPALATHWTARLGLAGLEHRYPGELSLGQQQRVALARALCREGRLLLLDEPLSALDAPLRARLREELAALQREITATTILVTHDPVEAILLSDEILLLEDGRVLQSGAVETVFSRPVSEAAARLLGAENVAAGWAVAPDRIDLGGVQIAVGGPALASGPVGWAVRPDGMRVGTERGVPGMLLPGGSVRGGQRRLRVRVGAAVLLASADTGTELHAGPCLVSIDPAAVQVWPVRSARQVTAAAEGVAA